MQSNLSHDLFAEFFDEFPSDEYGSLCECAHRKGWSSSERRAVWDKHLAAGQPAKVARRTGDSDTHWERLYHNLTQLGFDL